VYKRQTVGSGTFNANQTVTISAQTNPCFKFANWTEGATVVSTEESYTFKAAGSRNLVANFAAKIFTVLAEPEIGGTISGELKYSCGDVIEVSATANPGYKFDGWFANNKLLTIELTDDINIAGDFQVQAKFSIKK
jgi:hypothetical protein